MSNIMRYAVLFSALIAGAALAAEPLAFGGMDGLTRLQAGRTMRSSSSDENWRDGNADARWIPPGETLVIADLEGPGVIRHIWNTIAANERGYARLVVLRMYWDGEEHPSVECPLGDFFGIGHGIDEAYISLPFRVSSEGRARNCYWPMPFRKSARITVTNEGKALVNAFYYYVDWQQLPELPEDTPYFHAMYRQEHPTVMGRNYLIADIVGRGHYVGTVLNVHQLTASWWGEGDDFFFIDGEDEPSLRGTGSEDYFCDAWGFRRLEGPFYGVPVFEGYDAFSRTTAYRWHIPDPVTFTTALRLEIEHKGVALDETGAMRSGFEEREDHFSSVAYWYQLEPHKPFEPLPPAYDRLTIDYSNLLEAEAWLPGAQATLAAPTLQEGHWSGGGQLFWTPGEPNQTLTLTIPVEKTGEYDIILLPTYSHDYGMFVFELDGAPLGKRLDLYNASIAVREVHVGTRELAAGDHTLTIRNVGKSALSAGYFFGLDAVLLSPRDRTE